MRGADTPASIMRQLNESAAVLEDTGFFKVLRRLDRHRDKAPPADTTIHHGVFLDVETTGLDPKAHEVIELAMVPFTFSSDGAVYMVGEAFQKFRQPSEPITAEITELTGITNEMVAGHTITEEDLVWISSIDLVVAHNAAFDRQFAERLSPVFIDRRWGCSMAQIDWRREGMSGTKLAYLAMESGFFYERHRAVHDCHAAIELLARQLPRTGWPLAQLLERVRAPSFRIWAENSPFEVKDLLKARGYKWHAGDERMTKAWWVHVADEAAYEAEVAWLAEHVYRLPTYQPRVVTKITAKTRFSEREGIA